MGVFGKLKQGLKDATGLGLDTQEQYDRAFEKGVLLKDYNSAIKLFEKAAEKGKEGGADPELVNRALANAALYRLLNSKDVELIAPAIEALGPVKEIEQMNTDKETTATAPWIEELNALNLELQAESGNSLADKGEKYRQASKHLMSIGSTALSFADKLDLKGPKDKAMYRSYYDSARADYFVAQLQMLSSPSDAEGSLSKAAMQYRQASTPDEAQEIDGLIEKVKTKRHCWMCGREMQGKGIYFNYYPAETSEYHRSLTASGDTGMLEKDGSVTVCTVCGSAIEKQADRYATQRANEVRAWAEPILDGLTSAVSALQSQVERLERMAHRH